MSPRRWILAGTVLLVAVAAVAWFEPHTLFIDERVDEALPTATTRPDAATDADASTTTTAGPTEVARGDLISLDHGTTGVVRVLDVAGEVVVRFEDLDTSNGPDLYVYLTASPSTGEESAFDDDHVSLGRLKGNRGDQNYEVPAGTDLDRYATVVIWCDRFDSAFGAADLART